MINYYAGSWPKLTAYSILAYVLLRRENEACECLGVFVSLFAAKQALWADAVQRGHGVMPEDMEWPSDNVLFVKLGDEYTIECHHVKGGEANAEVPS